MEIFKQIKQTTLNKWEDNIYFLVALFFIIIYQIIMEVLNLIKRLFVFIFEKFSDRENIDEVKK